jgi:hypothetical protein
MDKHTLAIVSIAGSSLDVLGGLYLAYDLLGGEHGPLRTLTRIVTYGVLFGVGYGVALGPVFGILSGAAHGITLGSEYARASRGKLETKFWEYTLTSAIRGVSFALGGAYLYGALFGAVFGALATIGQILGYRIGIRPTLDYLPGTRPRITKRQFLTVLNRTVGYAIAGYAAAIVAHRGGDAIKVGLGVGLAVGVVTAIVITCTPFIEWGADHVPQRRMGVFGIALILVGFSLQSVQYWVALLDIPVR